MNSSAEILIITNSSGSRWIFPKGLVEPDMTPLQSAEMEAFEEAGIRGETHPEPVGKYQYRKWGGTCIVELYVMKVTEILEEWPEMEKRERQWVSPEKMLSVMDERIPRDLLNKVPPRLRKL